MKRVLFDSDGPGGTALRLPLVQAASCSAENPTAAMTKALNTDPDNGSRLSVTPQPLTIGMQFCRR
ncbi:hypothetical protein BHQ23_28130 [Mycobacterium gordonae]|uniref:Uncharacterized protein n=1 Tax=Mycobacterium gordonae TaxID=1778 RepID=A0A1A6B9A2_MYCGO|nr:hypothetical protein [Mycobacterium gordonae]PJE08671.1 MAG: hypothetical protein CK428_19590 [Mycobacterium sp.]MCV7008757.1 hypothetical protein [Mycobacterium gordonae]OBR98870.1 hypothetical protein A9W98_33285 [Mycobacterium gordonae]ODR16941.1 hypothetical protein BHQ23_28130 [Mycobacterium gordonae]ORV80880.1 hypothetical protein AWC08_29925 [Mycobacterium gordonae]